jgi:hypothetical protein
MATQLSTKPRTDAAAPPTTDTTQHGTVTWYTYSTAPSAAEQALQDSATFISKATPSNGNAVGGPEAEIGDIISAIGVGAQIIGTVVQAGQFGLGIANTARAYQNPSPQSNTTQAQQGVATIVLTNNALVPLAFSGVKTTGCQLAQAPSALTTGQSGNVLLTRDKPLDGSSEANVAFEIGTGPGANIPVSMDFNYSAANSVWTLSISVDSGTTFSFPQVAALAGCSFAPTATGYPNFSVYFAPIEAASGSMQVMVYPNSNFNG